MNITGIQGQDVNTLRRLLAQGLITEDDLSKATMSGGSYAPGYAPVQGTQNALSDLVNPGSQDQPVQGPSSSDLAAQGQQFVRNEDTGQTMYLGPNGPSDIPYGKQLQGQVPQAPQTTPNPSANGGPRIMPTAGQGQMRVVGSGGGQVTDLGTEPAKAVPLDYSRPQIDVPGVGRGYYGRDGNAYVPGPDGSMTKVLLGYDAQGSAALTNQKLAQAKTQADIEHTQEQIRASKVQTPDMGGTSSLTGDAFLQTIDPGTAAIVKKMVNGELPPPTGAALRSPRVIQLLAAAAQYDPAFDATQWAQRYATVKDFSPQGKSGQMVQKANQALHHAGLLLDSIGELDNSSILPGIVNPIKNYLEPKLNGSATAQGTYLETANALSEELKKIYAGGAGSLEQLRNWQSTFDPNASPEQQRAYLKRGMELLQGGLQSLQSSYARGMGPRANFGNLIDQAGKEGLAKIMQGGVDAGIGETLGVQASPTSGAAPSQPSAGAIQQSRIPPAAIAFLRQNPAARYDFDRKYGQGAAAQVLGR